jgi:hypothetical protein
MLLMPANFEKELLNEFNFKEIPVFFVVHTKPVLYNLTICEDVGKVSL